MKKRGFILLVVVLAVFTVGCVKGDREINKEPMPYKMLLNSGSTFVYTFQDTETGVWYISSEDGVTPRLNLDGSLYQSE